MNKIKVVLLGTNGWYDTDTGNTICTLIICPDFYIILDAGTGIYKLDRYINNEKPVYIFLSHFHIDHIQGLHILNKFKIKKGLYIFGQKGTKKALGTLINSPFSAPLENLPYETEIIEVPEQINKLPFKARVLPLEHSDITLGIQIEIGGKIISYCPDTDYCENAIKLAKNADLLITECAFKSGQENKEWPHLNPEKAAKIAKIAFCKKLVLVHFDANNYKLIDDRKNAENIAKKYFSDSIAGIDDMEIEV